MTSKASFAQRSIASFDPEIGRIQNPDRYYDHPREVLDDVRLALDEQRAILSSWASDACAVDSMPALRCAPFARRPVTFDDIMDALAQLDRQAARASSPRRRKERRWEQRLSR
jgi:hypothetical protein